MPVQYFSQNTDISLLQWDILKYIATHGDSGYQSIANALNRKRPTILQSVKPLLKKGFLERIKVDPTQRNSKVVLRLTRDGKDYIGSKKYLSATLISNYDIFSTESDPIVRDYLQMLMKVNDSNLLEDMMEELSYYLHSAPIADKKEKIKPEDNISAIKKAFFEDSKKSLKIQIMISETYSLQRQKGG